MRLSVLLACAGVLTLAGCGAPPETVGPDERESAETPPSIVLISIDTLRSDRLPAYGYDGVETPAIDALRADSILFERAYAQAPLTIPSHASILTGLLPAEHGVRDNIGYHFESGAVAYLPRLLAETGYDTGAAISAYVLRGDLGFADGFDFYQDSIEQRPRVGVGGLQRAGGETLDSALPWLRQRSNDPFFFFLHLFEPHTPYDPPNPSLYASPYDGEVAEADRIVGELLDELRALDLYDRSVIVLLSDHGEGLGDHGEDEHGVLLYRESLQVPLLVKLPSGDRGGTSVATPVALVDVFPTLLDLTGISRPEGLAGVSLLRARDGETSSRTIYAETFFPRLHFGWSDLASLVDGRYHFIEGPDPELYDLEADPGETSNIVWQERSVTARLRKELSGYERTLQAPGAVDPEERRALEALGYVGSTAPEPDGPLPDPKSRLDTVADLKNGLRHYSAGELEQAVAAYRRAVAANPRSLDAWEYLGRSLSELGRPGEALEAFERALELADGRASHLAVASALTLLNGRRPAEAIELLRREIAKSPDALELRLLEARALVITGRVDEALASTEAAARSAPDNADAIYMRGAVHIGRRDLDAGERDLRRALELAPDHTAAISDLAALMQYRGETDEARRLLERVLELNPGDTLARSNLSRLEQQMSRADGGP
ncbi:MAG: sulfatase-like hydrolase/transferase [bacterium]|nr:sulfatase-like hydrolase/transferase [bacterium]